MGFLPIKLAPILTDVMTQVLKIVSFEIIPEDNIEQAYLQVFPEEDDDAISAFENL